MATVQLPIIFYDLRTPSGAGEMTQLVKPMRCRPDLGHQNPYKKPGVSQAIAEHDFNSSNRRPK